MLASECGLAACSTSLLLHSLCVLLACPGRCDLRLLRRPRQRDASEPLHVQQVTRRLNELCGAPRAYRQGLGSLAPCAKKETALLHEAWGYELDIVDEDTTDVRGHIMRSSWR